MCGIFGLIGHHNQEEIKAANRTIGHRGPDAEGYWFDQDLQVAICHRRLSILDLSEAGAQPMKSESGRYIVSYNGEIYNFRELKSELKKNNWRGHSDTEILLACLEEWGLNRTIEKIEGMYGIALWDSKEKKLILVRDRLGEKPLYYGQIGQHFVFASELKPIIHLFKKELSLNQLAVADFFRRSCISGEQSIFQGIHKLKPGHFLVLSYEEIKQQRSLPEAKKYWSLDDIQLGSLKLSAREAIPELEAMLKKSVAQQMIADVSLGAFLSGGIDSSLIVSLMQSLSEKKVKTFSIGFASASHNEAPHAKAVAEHLGTEHEELYVSEKELLAQIPLLSKVYDEPFADSSQIPTILVSQMARRKVKVALSGDAGDELFAGYNRHQFAYQSWNRLNQLPLSLRNLAGQSMASISPETWKSIFDLIPVKASQPHEKIYKLARILQTSNLSEFYQHVAAHWTDGLPLKRQPHDLSWQDWKVHSALEMCLADAKWYLPDDILVKVDRAAMSQSLETRAPFLNKDVVEMAFALPMNLKIHKGQSKWILRQILYKYVPRGLVERPKMGFGVPLEHWLKNELKDWAWSLLSPEALARQDLLDSEIIQKKWDEHQQGRANWQTELWDVLMFLAWREQYKI